MFYHVQSATMEPCSLTEEAAEEAHRTWLCSGCHLPKPGVTTIDVQVDSRPGTDSPLNFAIGAGVPLARKTFLFRLDVTTLRRELYLGKVCDARGRLVEDWVTFRGHQRVILRGSKNVSHRVCDVCRRHLYFAMDDRYLCPAPSPGVTLMESHLFGLVLSAEPFAQLKVDEWRGVTVDELPVLAEPKDSLGDLGG